MPRLCRLPAIRAQSAIPLLATCLAGALQPAPAQDADTTRTVARASAEYQGFFARLDSLWIPFERGAATLSELDSLVLRDIAAVLALNHDLELRMWASAPDAARPRGSGERPTGSATTLARRRREAVRRYLLRLGADRHQLRNQREDPRVFPAGHRWRDKGGTFLFVARKGPSLNLPPQNARVRVRAAPGSEVFFVPLRHAQRGTTALCQPPALTRLGMVRADSVLLDSYPPRAIVAVARDTAKVIRTREHSVDAGKRPDVIDFTLELPDPRCR
ncbi:MAG TPA: hypothetical protein VFQ45_19835 [Longimicrobium sp.]|nr:hypothetical protein [Longimicrobium sp.]